MEPRQAKSVSKRRRRLVVTIVLVLLSLASWWFWPREDARFVGTWNVHAAALEESRPLFELKLSSNGIARITPFLVIVGPADGPKLSRRGSSSFAQWTVIDGSLRVGNPEKRPVSSITASLLRFARKYASVDLRAEDGFAFHLSSITDSKIEAELGTNEQVRQIELRRVAE